MQQTTFYESCYEIPRQVACEFINTKAGHIFDIDGNPFELWAINSFGENTCYIPISIGSTLENGYIQTLPLFVVDQYLVDSDEFDPHSIPSENIIVMKLNELSLTQICVLADHISR